jgi:hypothetical protein
MDWNGINPLWCLVPLGVLVLVALFRDCYDHEQEALKASESNWKWRETSIRREEQEAHKIHLDQLQEQTKLVREQKDGDIALLRKQKDEEISALRDQVRELKDGDSAILKALKKLVADASTMLSVPWNQDTKEKAQQWVTDCRTFLRERLGEPLVQRFDAPLNPLLLRLFPNQPSEFQNDLQDLNWKMQQLGKIVHEMKYVAG